MKSRRFREAAEDSHASTEGAPEQQVKSARFAPAIPMPDLPQRPGAESDEEPGPGEVQGPSNAALERDMRMIPVNLIDPHPLAPREVYTPQMIAERAEALRTQGQHDPIHVIPNPIEAGRYVICDGWTRVQACTTHQVADELFAEVHHGLSIEESAWYGYQQNEEREQHCDLDRAMFYEKLIGSGEAAAEVARRAGVSKAHMTNFRAYSKLPADVMEIIKADPKKFGANAAYQILKVVDRVGVKQAVRLAARFSEENHTFSWLVGQVQTMVEPRHARSPTSTRQIRFANGFYKQKGDAFEVSITVAPTKRAQFAAALEELLETVAQDETPAEPASSKTEGGGAP